MKKGWIIFFTASAIILILCFVLFRQGSIAKIDSVIETYQAKVKIGEKIINVDMAISPIDREKGLSERDSLFEDEGMLFVFDIPGKYGFWMKDMNFAIDIIWIGENFEVVHIKENAIPNSFPEVFSPSSDSKYVLETVSGFSKKYNIRIGDKFEILP